MECRPKLLLSLLLLLTSPLLANESWQIVAEEYRNAWSIRLLLSEQAKPTAREWIRLEITNEGLEELRIKTASYRLDLQAFAGSASQPILEGSIHEDNFLALLAPQPQSSSLPVGRHQLGEALSARGTALLKYPYDQPFKVSARLLLHLETAKEDLDIEWPGNGIFFSLVSPERDGKRRSKSNLRPSCCTIRRLHRFMVTA